MRNKFAFFILSLFSMLHAQDREVEYIKKYALLAVEEMEKYKIPASITLAQGILETGGGQSRLAEEANNHFGIKCKKEWTGESITHDDDAIGECFRKYNSVKESYEDHSKFLAERPYYKKLFDLPLTDYKAWAHGLKKAGYATNPRYAGILISKIEKYQLQDFDYIKPREVYDKVVALYGPTDRKIVDPDFKEVLIVEEKKKDEPVSLLGDKAIKVTDNKTQAEREDLRKTAKKINAVVPPTPEEPIAETSYKSPSQRVQRHPIGREFIEVLPGETVKQIAETYDISVKKLMRYNELESPRDLKAGQYLFFARKKRRGAKDYHKVEKGETMYLISQKEGIKLSSLYYLNRMDENDILKAGDILYLRKRKKRN